MKTSSTPAHKARVVCVPQAPAVSFAPASGTVDVTPPPLKATLSVPATSDKRNSVVPLTTAVTRGTQHGELLRAVRR